MFLSKPLYPSLDRFLSSLSLCCSSRDAARSNGRLVLWKSDIVHLELSSALNLRHGLNTFCRLVSRHTQSACRKLTHLIQTRDSHRKFALEIYNSDPAMIASDELRPGDIERCFHGLQALQNEAFSQIASISITDDDYEGSIESRRTKITRRVQQTLNNYRDLLDILKAELNSSGNYDFYKEDYLAYQQKLSHLRVRLRESQLLSSAREREKIHQARIDKYAPRPNSPDHTEAREQLFAGRSTTKTKETVDDQIFAHNKSITAALQSTRQMMASSIVQTGLNIDNLDQQTQDITQLSFKLSDLTATLGKSKNIVRFIEKQDKQDKKRIYMSIGFLLLCSAWVLWRRILRLPVRLLLWTILKVFRVFSWFLPNMNFDFSASKMDTAAASSLVVETLLSTTLTDLPSVLSILSILSISSISSISSILSAIESAILVVSDMVIDIDTNNAASTWEDVVTTALQYAKDEL